MVFLDTFSTVLLKQILPVLDFLPVELFQLFDSFIHGFASGWEGCIALLFHPFAAALIFVES